MNPTLQLPIQDRLINIIFGRDFFNIEIPLQLIGHLCDGLDDGTNGLRFAIRRIERPGPEQLLCLEIDKGNRLIHQLREFLPSMLPDERVGVLSLR